MHPCCLGGACILDWQGRGASVVSTSGNLLQINSPRLLRQLTDGYPTQSITPPGCSACVLRWAVWKPGVISILGTAIVPLWPFSLESVARKQAYRESSTETWVPHKHGVYHSVKELLLISPGTAWTGIDVKAIRVRRISKGVGFSFYPKYFTNQSYHFLMFQVNPWNATVCDHICEGKGGAKARPPTMKVSYTPPFHSLIPLPVPPELKPGNHNILGNESLRGEPMLKLGVCKQMPLCSSVWKSLFLFSLHP